jgi:hypothetical protein
MLIFVEEQMRGLWFRMACVLIILGTEKIVSAEEFLGKLERVDWETVTLRDGDNNKLVAKVDLQSRREAAVLLGKTVTVDLMVENGDCRAVGFRSNR